MASIDKFKTGERITWLGVIVNIFLARFKISAGLIGRSQAMLSDGFHSLSDVLAGGLVLGSLKVSRKPIDDTHPYGHGKVESIAAFIIALLLFGTAIVLLYSAFGIILRKEKIIPGILPLFAAIISILVKEIMFRSTHRIGEKLSSPAIIANAYDHRSDAVSSIAALGGIIGARLGYYFLDPLAGFIVALLIFKMGMKVFRSATAELMDASLPLAYRDKISKLTLQIEEVKSIKLLKTRKMGQHNYIELKIEVEPYFLLEEADEVAKKVKEVLSNESEHPGEIMVYVEPGRKDFWEEKIKLRKIEEILSKHSRKFTDFHDLRIVRIGKEECADFHIVLPQEMSVEEAYNLSADLERDIKGYFPKIEVVIRFDQPR